MTERERMKGCQCLEPHYYDDDSHDAELHAIIQRLLHENTALRLPAQAIVNYLVDPTQWPSARDELAASLVMVPGRLTDALAAALDVVRRSVHEP